MSFMQGYRLQLPQVHLSHHPILWLCEPLSAVIQTAQQPSLTTGQATAPVMDQATLHLYIEIVLENSAYRYCFLIIAASLLCHALQEML